MSALSLAACRSGSNPANDSSVIHDMTKPEDGFVTHDFAMTDMADASDMPATPDGAVPDMAVPLFGTPVTVGVENGPIYLATTDLNSDGKADLVVANSNDPDGSITGTVTPSTVNVLLGVGDGTFATKVSTQISANPFSVSTSDLNGDGHPDVVITNGDGIDVLLGSAAGTLGAVTHTTVGTSGFCRSNAVGDIDGDGKLDVVVADQGDNVSQGLVWVLPGNGDGTFGTQASFPVSTATDGNIRWANVVRLGLMDNDAKLDVVTANVNTNTFSVLVNTSTVGSANLSAPFEFASAQVPQDILVAQLDAVNKTDIVVVDQNGNAVDVYLSQDNTAAISYNKAVVYAAGPGPTAAAFGDVDGDNRADIVVSNGQQGLVSVILGGAGGTFGAATSYPVGTDPVSIVTGSFNSTVDTKIDVATANQVSNDVSVLLNRH